MSIDRISISSLNIDRTQSASGTQGVDPAQHAKQARISAQEDNVSLSSKAKEIERFLADVEQSRADRLNEVRKALEAGTYNVSGKDIARALIDTNKKL